MTKEELQDIKEWVAKGWGLSIEESLKLINEYERLRQALIYRDQEIEWYHGQLQQKEQEIKDLKFQKRPTYVTIEGTVEDVHKDLKKIIVENDELKQEVDRLKEQLRQTQVKMERYEKALKDMLNPDEMLLWLSKNKQENVADYYHFKAKKALED
jgi:uncharacterized coiled-coil DUF342 family protein